MYERAIEFGALTAEIVEQAPPGDRTSVDQLVRSSESMIRNIADGAYRSSDADRAAHYEIARGDAIQCAASLDTLKTRGLVTKDRYDRGVALLEAVVAMLTKVL